MNKEDALAKSIATYDQVTSDGRRPISAVTAVLQLAEVLERFDEAQADRVIDAVLGERVSA